MNLNNIERRMRDDGYSEEYIERIIDDYVDHWIEDNKDRELIEKREAQGESK